MQRLLYERSKCGASFCCSYQGHHDWFSNHLVFSSWSVLPESSAVSASVSPYSNSRLGDSMELCEEQNTHEHVYIIVWHWAQLNHRCPDSHAHTSNILQAIHNLQHLLKHYSICGHTLQLHTFAHAHSSGSFTVWFHHVYIWSFDWLLDIQAALITHLHFFPLRSHSQLQVLYMSTHTQLQLWSDWLNSKRMLSITKIQMLRLCSKLQWGRSEERGVNMAPCFRAD